MNCPLCKKREVSSLAARECERKNYRFMCAVCLVETYRGQKPKVWPRLTLAPAIRIELEEAA